MSREVWTVTILLLNAFKNKSCLVNVISPYKKCSTSLLILEQHSNQPIRLKGWFTVKVASVKFRLTTRVRCFLHQCYLLCPFDYRI